MIAFTRTSGALAWAAALGGVLYAVAFVVLGDVTAAAVLLMVGGLLSSLILVAIGGSLTRQSSAPAAGWAVAVGVLRAVLSLVHGGYDLARQVNATPAIAGYGNYPSQVDPRGLATFGLVGLAFAVLGRLLQREPDYPPALGVLGTALGASMIVIYVGRLVILDPGNGVVRLALAIGLVLNTIFLIWLGGVWRKGRPAPEDELNQGTRRHAARTTTRAATGRR